MMNIETHAAAALAPQRPSRLSPDQVVRLYLAALAEGSYVQLMTLFAPDAVVVSPLYGTQAAHTFYRALLDDTHSSVLTLNGVFANEDEAQVIGYFRYDWVLADGSPVSFDCCDVFDLNEDGHITRLKIIYDTFYAREAHRRVSEGAVAPEADLPLAA